MNNYNIIPYASFVIIMYVSLRILYKSSSRDRANSVKRDCVGPFPGVSA